MKLGSLKGGGRDGTLVVASRDLSRAIQVPEIAATLQNALDRWEETAPRLAAVYEELNESPSRTAFQLDPTMLAAPLPRAYQWIDGSAYLNHVELVRRARGAGMPENFYVDPLMYQGGSDFFLGARDAIRVESEDWGVDFEAEIAVVLGGVPMGAPPALCGRSIRLLMLVNDVSLRNLIPAELAKGFGFLHGKPPTAFSPVAVTPDELGAAWDGGKAHLPLISHVNDALFGRPNAGVDMQFDFPTLIAHAARTRPLGAGTIVGSGTVSNRDRRVGFSCIAERRAVETVEGGTPETRFLHFGDRIRIEALDRNGGSIFGAIKQEVVRYRPPHG